MKKELRGNIIVIISLILGSLLTLSFFYSNLREDIFLSPGEGSGGCIPDCKEKVCGDDGCGGSCGECKECIEKCEEGKCIPSGKKKCSGLISCIDENLCCDPTKKCEECEEKCLTIKVGEEIKEECIPSGKKRCGEDKECKEEYKCLLLDPPTRCVMNYIEIEENKKDIVSEIVNTINSYRRICKNVKWSVTPTKKGVNLGINCCF
ncbi:MAG: hypothetical protein QW273_00280 [Candidatus Pacearchaeota archaeon]